MSKIIQILIRIGFIALIIGALAIFGRVVNEFLSWSFLVTFFAVVRNLLNMLNWLIDIPTLVLLITITLSIEVAYWIYEASVVVTKFFRNL